MKKDNRPEVILIAAMAANRVIGRGGEIPWHIPGEQTRFKEITMGYPILMGRKTWQAIGRPLPGRRSIVLSRNKQFQAKGAEIVPSLAEGIALCQDAEKIFVIGGEQVYRQALELADTIILTVLPYPVTGDACFPEIPEQAFTLSNVTKYGEEHPYRVELYTRCSLDTH